LAILYWIFDIGYWIVYIEYLRLDIGYGIFGDCRLDIVYLDIGYLIVW